MKAWHRLLLALLLWVELKGDVVMAICMVSDSEYGDTGRCVCAADSLQKPLQMMMCLQMSELELQDGVLQLQSKFLSMQDSDEIAALVFLPLERILFTRVRIPGVFLSALLNTLPKTKVHHLDFTQTTLEALTHPPNPTEPCPVTALRMDRVTFDPSLLLPPMHPLYAWLLSSLNHLTLRGVPGGLLLGNEACATIAMLANVTELDLSENGLTDESLVNLTRCISSSAPPVSSLGLSVLRLSQNQVRSLEGLCPLLQASPNLAELDLSQNTLDGSAFGSDCLNSTGQLKTLNLSSTGIQTADGLVPAGVEVLDLSGNRLWEFRNPPEGLRELYLSNNLLSLLPDLTRASQLQFLSLDGNRLTDLSSATSFGLVLDRLLELRVGRNPFTCGCEIIESVELLRGNRNKVLDWPDAFLCTPLASNSTTLRLEDLELTDCDQAMDEASSGMKMNVDVALCMSVVVAAVTLMLE
ncbi:toll-like receptor 2 [Alosa sapidissima]|uniref:toll-like receptor 2 n=1 Tax=Alosa sapidissima TaxID=34773 RepID=UPI001C0832A2|nr:toll-like receptor 2 [Alosa sapidissima]